MPTVLHLEPFLERPGTIFDVRSPSEFQHGHIPSSYSLPLFTDEERALVGTAYKLKSHKAAIHLGLELVGPKLSNLVQKATLQLFKNEGRALCWRGGMRSSFVAHLLESIGFNITTLHGGYKSFRRWVLRYLSQLTQVPLRLYVLGGLTGSGKTAILQCLQNLGEQVIDLESLANHRGSAFGMIGLSSQPSQEQFENRIAYLLANLNLNKPIWIEDESRLIGTCHIPPDLYQKMLNTPLINVIIPQQTRLQNLLNTYGLASPKELIHCTKRIAKRLGNQLTKEIIDLFEQNQKEKAFNLLLGYYDKTYRYHLNQRQKIYSIEESFFSPLEWALYLQKFSNNLIKYIYTQNT